MVCCSPKYRLILDLVKIVLAIIQFARKQAQLNDILSRHNTITVSRYFRLMALALTESLCTTPLAIFSLWLNATSSPIEPWRGWSDTHFNFSRIIQVPATLWRLNHITAVSFELTRWLPVVCALVFFGFFGFAEEARRHYRLAIACVGKALRLRGLSEKITTVSFPSYVNSFFQ